jgi:general secretion pathway protein B
MSYILDALRRADAERSRGAVPGLHAHNIPADNEPAARDFRPLIRAAAVVGMLVVAGVGVLVLAPWRDAAVPVSHEPPAPAPAPERDPTLRATAPAPSAQGELPAQPPLARRDGDAAPQPPQQVPQPPPQSSPYPPPAYAVAPAPGRAGPAQPDPTAGPAPARIAPPQRGNDARRVPPAPGAAAANVANAPVEHYGPPLAATPARAAAVPGINDLPPNVRAQLPRLSVGGSIYSETPSARMVILNGQVYHEGDKPAADTVLEQIRLKSAVLSYRGERFEIAF